ncbi:HAD-IIIA family hydrolase [Saccharopolyspora cebuensis]|uniref:D,D-heptose 1,7-bisphosphate phosphatase n=1 Tax=Saccharopolyspora cebuensis TaxID=418759 RepID=A0ABV4CLD1_9PSEU
MSAPQRHRYAVVIPTTGRESLLALLHALETAAGPPPEEVVVVDDRPRPELPLALPPTGLDRRVLTSGGRGPAAARNAGWRGTEADWVVFLDDDVLPGPWWREQLAQDLDDVAPDVAACQGRIVVPLPAHRRPTDAERGTAGLAGAWWITADMAYRRDVLTATGGFDEDFPRAFREDADLALRVQALGHRLVNGGRTTEHPAPVGSLLTSVRAQRGNADNAVMRRKHGPGWRRLSGEGPGRTRLHLLTTAAAGLAPLALSRRPALRRAGRLGAAVWLASTLDFAVRRVLPGPRTPAELGRMAVSSALIPPAACWHRLRGEVAVRRRGRMPAAVLFDRDDTLIHDVPYNGDPDLVRPVPGVRAALDRLRAKGVPLGVVSNQSGIARGLLTGDQVEAVNAELRRLLGPFGTVQVCAHGEDDGCGCRKPAPGLVRRAAEALAVEPGGCVVVGDTGGDVGAALAAGARAFLVPTRRTRCAEIEHAALSAQVARTVSEAVDRLLRGGVR